MACDGIIVVFTNVRRLQVLCYSSTCMMCKGEEEEEARSKAVLSQNRGIIMAPRSM